jgi:hypothetical protein
MGQWDYNGILSCNQAKVKMTIPFKPLSGLFFVPYTFLIHGEEISRRSSEYWRPCRKAVLCPLPSKNMKGCDNYNCLHKVTTLM